MIRDWRTSVAGIVSGVAGLAALRWPEHATLLNSIASIALILLGVNSAQTSSGAGR